MVLGMAWHAMLELLQLQSFLSRSPCSDASGAAAAATGTGDSCLSPPSVTASLQLLSNAAPFITETL